MARSVYTLRIPSSTRYLEDVRRFVADHAARSGLPEGTVEEFKIAVDEACTNVIKHAYKGDEARQVDVAVIVEPDRFTVRIRDEGEAFNQASYEEPNLVEAVHRRRAGGLGVHIIRRLMDRVEYRTRGRVNEVQLTKYRSGVGPHANGET